MKKKFNIMLCTLIGVLSACNEYDFDQEQYRNEVGLLSNSSLIYDRQVANVGQEKDTIYLEFYHSQMIGGDAVGEAIRG